MDAGRATADSASLDHGDAEVHTSPIEDFEALFVEERTRLYFKLALEALGQGNMMVAATYIRNGKAHLYLRTRHINAHMRPTAHTFSSGKVPEALRSELKLIQA